MPDEPDKPIENPSVFLSHSAKDAETLILLKQLLEDRAAGSVTFFLSSDGDSLELGKNWVVGVEDALANTRLMFAFLTENSIRSDWVLFEVGVAHGKRIPVVPVLLPGFDTDDFKPPLQLLHGFKLHAHKALNALARKINQTCKRKLKEDFTPEDFQKIFGAAGQLTGTYFGQWTAAIDSVSLESKVRLPKGTPWHPVADLLASFQANSPEAPAETKYDSGDHNLEGMGISANQRTYAQGGPEEGNDCQLSISVVPELLHLYAPAMDKWFHDTKPAPLRTTIKFTTAVKMIGNRQRVTSKLYGSPMAVGSHNKLKYGHVAFELDTVASSALTLALANAPVVNQPTLSFKYEGNFGCFPLPEIIAILFQRGVFTWER